jgi:hypothetical protein
MKMTPTTLNIEAFIRLQLEESLGLSQNARSPNGVVVELPPANIEPASELNAHIPMPLSSRPVTVHITNRATLAPNPILPEDSK